MSNVQNIADKVKYEIHRHTSELSPLTRGISPYPKVLYFFISTKTFMKIPPARIHHKNRTTTTKKKYTLVTRTHYEHNSLGQKTYENITQHTCPPHSVCASLKPIKYENVHHCRNIVIIMIIINARIPFMQPRYVSRIKTTSTLALSFIS